MPQPFSTGGSQNQQVDEDDDDDEEDRERRRRTRSRDTPVAESREGDGQQAPDPQPQERDESEEDADDEPDDEEPDPEPQDTEAERSAIGRTLAGLGFQQGADGEVRAPDSPDRPTRRQQQARDEFRSAAAGIGISERPDGTLRGPDSPDRPTLRQEQAEDDLQRSVEGITAAPVPDTSDVSEPAVTELSAGERRQFAATGEASEVSESDGRISPASTAVSAVTLPASVAAARLNIGDRVDSVMERGTTEDPMSDRGTDAFRSAIGDPGAPVRQFGSGLSAMMQDQTLDIDVSDEVRGLLNVDVTEGDIQSSAQDVGEFAVGELDPRTPSPVDQELDIEITGGPPPGISLIGPRGGIQAASRLASAFRARGASAPSGAARSGPAGGGAGQSVGRMGEFAVEGVDSVVRAGATVGVAGATVSELPAEQPTQEVNEVDIEESRPVSEIESPTEPTRPVEELEPGSAQVSELEPTTEPQTSGEIDVEMAQGMTRPEGVEREEDPRIIDEDDLIGEFPDPEQDPPSVRERQRRDDLVTFEREFPTGQGAVIGRESFQQEELDISPTTVEDADVGRFATDRATITETPPAGAAGVAAGDMLGVATDDATQQDSLTDVGVDVASDVDLRLDVGMAQTTATDVTAVTTPDVALPNVAQPTSAEFQTQFAVQGQGVGAPDVPVMMDPGSVATGDTRRRRDRDSFDIEFELDFDPLTGEGL